jgi:hypothetical protein
VWVYGNAPPYWFYFECWCVQRALSCDSLELLSLPHIGRPMDLTLDEEGAQVTAATSFDANFPPKNILDG